MIFELWKQHTKSFNYFCNIPQQLINNSLGEHNMTIIFVKLINSLLIDNCLGEHNLTRPIISSNATSSLGIFPGLLIGSLIGGRIGDRLGRKRTFGIGALVVIPCVVIGGFIPNYWAYVFFRLVTCTSLPIMWIAAHTYGLEYFSPSKRRLLLCIRDFPIAAFLQVLLVYLNRHWSYLHLWTGVVCLCGIPSYFFIPESPRWMAMNGRKEEAEKVFHGGGRNNVLLALATCHHPFAMCDCC